MARKRKSITRIYMGYMVMLAVISISTIGFFWVSREYSIFQTDSREIRESFLKERHALMRGAVDTAIDYIEYHRLQTEIRLRQSIQSRVYEAHGIAANIYDQNRDQKSEDDIRRMIKDALRPVRFNNGRGYYFIVSLDGVEELYPVMPRYENQNLLGLQDAKGNYVIRDEIDIIRKQGEGFVVDYWMKPHAGDEMIYPKITFVKAFEPLGWYIGTGEYLDDVRADIEQEVFLYVRNQSFGEGDDGYVFIIRLHDISGGKKYGVMEVNRNRPEQEGTLLSDEAPDAVGRYFVKDILRQLRTTGEGVISYTYQDPSTGEYREKMAFCKLYRPWNLVVGAEVFLDEIDRYIELRKSNLEKRIVRNLFGIGAILVLALGIIFIIARYLFMRITGSLRVLTDFFGAAATESVTINADELEILEFQMLAHSANVMIEKRNRAEREIREHRSHLELINKILRHDLINNLSVIKSALRLYRDEGDQEMLPEVDRFVDKSVGLIRRMRELEAFVLMSKELKVLEVKDVIKNVISAYPAVNITVEGSCPVVADESLESVIDNILKNALIHGKAERIAISIGSDDDICCVRVADDGSGIPDEVKAHVFEEGFTYGETGQTGLGMYIVHKAMERYGGSATLEDNTPRGTVVVLRFNMLNA